MTQKCFFFAGGGTGGHIYPAVAVAEKIAELEPSARICFFVSKRDIDKHILSKAGFEYTALPGVGFSVRPDRFVRFCKSLVSSYRIAAQILSKSSEPVIVGVGGYVAAPVCYAGHRLRRPVYLINVDIVPGRANKLIARWAKQIFAQFDETAEYFKTNKHKVSVVGCPLRSGFEKPDGQRARDALGLDNKKKILLVTGASSGSRNINRTICALLNKLGEYADDWQIVHLTGRANYDQIKTCYIGAKIRHKVVDYCDDMADLLAAAEIVVGRSGAVSVAEYASAGVASICMPYPHHKDLHQYLNAGKLVEAGGAVIVDDIPDQKERAAWLWEELEPLLNEQRFREQMKRGSKSAARTDAAKRIAGVLVTS